MIPSPDPIQPVVALIVALNLGAVAGLVLCMREDLGSGADLGSLGADWWVDRARKGGGGS